MEKVLKKLSSVQPFIDDFVGNDVVEIIFCSERCPIQSFNFTKESIYITFDQQLVCSMNSFKFFDRDTIATTKVLPKLYRALAYLFFFF
jgi:hypothetical protein